METNRHSPPLVSYTKMRGIPHTYRFVFAGNSVGCRTKNWPEGADAGIGPPPVVPRGVKLIGGATIIAQVCSCRATPAFYPPLKELVISKKP